MGQIFAALLFVMTAFANVQNNNLPDRLQWVQNHGYAGEVSLISAGLYFGQYASQYDVRACLTEEGTQKGVELLLGLNDAIAAERMHLTCEVFDSDLEQNPDQFLLWLKEKVGEGYPVAIGVFMNQYRFHKDMNPSAGEPDYDHIVTVTEVGSNYPLNDPTYYPDNWLGFGDHGLWGDPLDFTCVFGPFQATREKANAMEGPIYSLPMDWKNYGIAITGIKDLYDDTFPVRVDTDLNYEKPGIDNHSNDRPPAMPITLTITVSGLEPNVPYNLYRYNSFDSVPEFGFNTHADQAFEHWTIQIESGSTYTQTEEIQSNEIAIYRCVPASAS